MMLLCLLAGLDGATSRCQRPAAMVTRSPPSQQVADPSKVRHIAWRAQGHARVGLSSGVAVHGVVFMHN